MFEQERLDDFFDGRLLGGVQVSHPTPTSQVGRVGPPKSGQRAAEAGKKANERKAPPRLVEGAHVQGWKAALAALTIAYPDRLTGRI